MIVLYHIVAKPQPSQALRNGYLLPSLAGNLPIMIDGDVIMAAGARIITADILTKNGIIHQINSVMIPPGAVLPEPRTINAPVMPPTIKASTESPTKSPITNKDPTRSKSVSTSDTSDYDGNRPNANDESIKKATANFVSGGDDDSNSISGLFIVGIVISTVVGTSLSAALYIISKRRRQTDEGRFEDNTSVQTSGAVV